MAAADLPKLTGRVVDDAGMIDAATRAALTQKLADFQKQGSDQIVVATVPEPFPISPHAGTRTTRKPARRLSSARTHAGETSSGLACRSTTRSGERVQVVCE